MKRRSLLVAGIAVPLLLSCGGARADGPPAGDHPRFLVGGAKATLAANFTAHKPEITALVGKCDKHAGETIDASYQGFDWVDQMSACALAWHATGDAARGAQAVKYWKALLSDRDKVGDGQGGLDMSGSGVPIVAQDSGYSMRTFGSYGALGLDWLWDAPGVDAALRSLAVGRLDAWGDWYAKSGYLNDTPTGNYFAGYFFATWAAAIAVGGDDATVGPKLWARATDLTDRLVAPALAGPLAGGDWYEGWEYGELSVAEYALASAAAAEQGRASFADDYLRDVVRLHLYALRPGGEEFYGAGDHGEHPIGPGATSMWGALVLLPGDPVAGWARRWVAKVPDTSLAWANAIAEARASAWDEADWTTAGLPLSYFARGSGAVFARSGWGDADTWVTFRASGRGAPDHQHADAGHFELVRGADALAADPMDYGSWATKGKNTMLFDDGGAVSLYPPNQGAWGSNDTVHVVHFADLGGAVVAQADFAGAYADNQDRNSVSLARREVVYLRPDVLVVNDRAAMPKAKSTDAYTFALHTTESPTVDGARLVADVGASRLTSRSLVPEAPERRVVTEPDGPSDSPWVTNKPFGDSFRAEETQRGGTSAAFVHVLTATASGALGAQAASAIDGVARVVRVAPDGAHPARYVVLPISADGTGLPLPVTVHVGAEAHADVVAFGLAAADHYQVKAERAGELCALTIDSGSDPNVASGDLGAALHLASCALVAPESDPCASGACTAPAGGEPPVGSGAAAADAGGGGGCAIATGRDARAELAGLVALGAALALRRSRRRRAPRVTRRA